MTFKYLKNIVLPVLTVSLSVLFLVAGCNKTEKYLRVERSSFEFEAGPQSETITVESSSQWLPHCNDKWIETYRDENDAMHIVIAQTNESLSSREGEIEVINGDAQKVIISILQKAINAAFTVTPQRLDFDGKGETKTIAVEAKNIRRWGASSITSWLVVPEGIFEQDETLSITVASSNLFVPRKDTIEIGSVVSGLEIAIRVPVEQAGVNLIVSHEQLVNNTLEIGAEAHQIELGIMCAYSWTLSVDTPVTPSETSGPADEIGTPVTISIPLYAGAESITHTLTFTCGGEEYEIYIIQSASV